MRLRRADSKVLARAAPACEMAMSAWRSVLAHYPWGTRAPPTGSARRRTPCSTRALHTAPEGGGSDGGAALGPSAKRSGGGITKGQISKYPTADSSSMHDLPSASWLGLAVLHDSKDGTPLSLLTPSAARCVRLYRAHRLRIYTTLSRGVHSAWAPPRPGG